jgi:hypothetical protein
MDGTLQSAVKSHLNKQSSSLTDIWKNDSRMSRVDQ